jgi:hypothetical protein
MRQVGRARLEPAPAGHAVRGSQENETGQGQASHPCRGEIPMTSDPNAIRQAQFAEVQQHLTRMTAYATGRASISLPESVLDNVVRLTNKPADQLTEDDQKVMWTTLDALTRKVQPATPASIRIGLEYEGNGQRRADGTKPDHYARRGIRRAMAWLACSMVLAFALHMYVSWGLSIVHNIDQTRKEMDQLREAIKTAVVTDPVLKAVVEVPKTGSVPLPSTRPGQAEVEAKLERLKSLSVQFEAQHDRLHHWRNLSLNWGLAWQNKIVGEDEFAEAKKLAASCPLQAGNDMQNSCQRAVDVLNEKAYNDRKIVEENALDLLVIVPATLLPLLFGLVGANCFILREYYERLRTMRLSEEVISYAHIRRWLGMILGVIVGVLFSAETISAKTGLTIVAVAFLAGYSVELAFNLVQAMIDRIASAVAPERRREAEEIGQVRNGTAPPSTVPAPVIALAAEPPAKPAAA